MSVLALFSTWVIRNKSYLLAVYCLFLTIQILIREPVVSAAAAPILDPQEIRRLPGRLDNTLVFNSNSPEVVQTEGILLSTFPPDQNSNPAAHLNQPLSGRFDLFAHHISNQTGQEQLKTLYLGIVLRNAGKRPVKVSILQAASYLSQPDAPFIKLPPQLENPDGLIFAGPGDRVMNDILRDKRQSGWPREITLAPKQDLLLFNQPIPVNGLVPPLNGRTVLARLKTSGPVYVASLAAFARPLDDGQERAPVLSEWVELLKSGQLSGPREKPAHPATATQGIVYGRVAGLARGSTWHATIADTGSGSPDSGKELTIPQVGHSYSYVLSTVDNGTFGTNQIQSAPLVVHYPDTAYQAHGNYGVEYNLTLPLFNNSSQKQAVSITLQTPLKNNQNLGGLQFLDQPADRAFFRGTVRLQYLDDNGIKQNRYLHLVQKQGEKQNPLLTCVLKPHETRVVNLSYLYPPDATPPQVLTITSAATP